MRPLFIAFAVLLLVVSGNAKDVSKADSEQNKANDQTTPENPSTRIEINVGNPSDAAPSQHQEQHAIAEAKPTPITKGEWLIAGITAVYAVISYFTFGAIKRQANIAQRSADAEVAVQSPWIMVNIEYTPGMSRTLGATREKGGPEIHHTDFVFRFDCINHGKTPAVITEKSAKLIIVTKDTLPAKPDFSDAKVFDNHPEPLAAGEASKEKRDEYFSAPGYQGFDEWVVLYGVVKYRDVFGRDDRQTTFGYIVTLGNKIERLPGYSEYNKNT